MKFDRATWIQYSHEFIKHINANNGIVYSVTDVVIIQLFL